MAKELEPCPQCGGAVEIFPSYGGRSSGEQLTYFASCNKCKAKVDHLGIGRKTSAIAAWNKYVREQRK